jgi:hypothetical protein
MAGKYQVWYDDIVERAKGRQLDCYKESHHILPRSLGGFDGPSNLVELTYREHFLAHWLLTKIYDGDARRSMIYALHCMTFRLGDRIIAGWQFEVAKHAVKAAVLEKAERRREVREELGRQRQEKAQRVAEKAANLAIGFNPRDHNDRERMNELGIELRRTAKMVPKPPKGKRHRRRPRDHATMMNKIDSF